MRITEISFTASPAFYSLQKKQHCHIPSLCLEGGGDPHTLCGGGKPALPSACTSGIYFLVGGDYFFKFPVEHVQFL